MAVIRASQLSGDSDPSREASLEKARCQPTPLNIGSFSAFLTCCLVGDIGITSAENNALFEVRMAILYRNIT